MIELRKQQALLRVQRERVLGEVYALEPRALESIIDQALAQESVDQRWHAYESLKQQASHIVGWDSPHTELCTTTHYEVLLAFIDWLLPVDRDETDTEEIGAYVE